MKFRTTITAVAVSVGLAGLLVIPVQADEALFPPQKVIETTSNTLQTNLRKKEFKKDFVRANRFVEEVVDPHVDFNRVSSLVLGRIWKNATTDQKNAFKKEFRRLLIRTYTRAFLEYAEWKIDYLPLRMKADGKKVLVKTKILRPGARPISVEYRMILKGNAWNFYDVVIEGISLVTNYRTSFRNEVAKTGSLDDLIHRLAMRNDKALGIASPNSQG